MLASTGVLQFDPLKGTKHFEPWWALLSCDKEIADYYAWHLLRRGIEVNTASPWGTHVSVIKGEVPNEPAVWGKYNNYSIEFHYTNLIRFDNGKHAWVDVYSEDLSALRQELGFAPRPWYHLTIGRLVKPYAN